jgi:hypothetical protein
VSSQSIKEEDMDVLDEDDAQTEQLLFPRRSFPERAEPAKKRKTKEADKGHGGAAVKLYGFSFGLDWMEWGEGKGVVDWERVRSALKR